MNPEQQGPSPLVNRGLVEAARMMNKRMYMCTECHKAFRSREELYVHAEMCLLEAFENEAANMMADMPQLRHSPPAPNPPSGITATASDRPPPLQRSDHQSKPLPSGLSVASAGTGGQLSQQIQGSFREIRKPMVYGQSPANVAAAVAANSRLIENASGLKLMVSVEKPKLPAQQNIYEDDEDEEDDEEMLDEGDSTEDLDDDDGLTGDMEEGEEYDEDVSVPHTAIRTQMRPSSSGKIIGALANADDDPFKPKMECPTCGLVLYRHNFSTHYRIHTGEMPFACQYCAKRFRTTSALKVHIRAHTGEKPYECPKCSYACITKRNLDRHIINNHVREGERRGPRYRRSRYRDAEDGDELYLDLVEQHQQEEEADDHHYVVLDEGAEEGPCP